ncbi:MAG: Nicotinate dehydrogenase FAD-subunit [Pelotomaculum sp. PtaB.Bin104]|nr:MAG: Nicotinate dehydrogenase FAD-subunit [Pelotomaculum sp. PtaB.Bin104]
MFSILNLVQPESIEEAYRILADNQKSAVLGGCTFLRLGSQKIETAIDLSKLNLSYIKEHDDAIEIGAMTTFRAVETHPVFIQYFNGVLAAAVGQIMGVQFRNLATVGATVYAKYGFSDLITPLLALDTEVELFKGGRMPLEKFLEGPGGKDILTRIFIRKNQRKAVYQNLRNSSTDFSILNVTASNLEGEWRIVVGARPLKAKIARKASDALSQGELSPEKIEGAAIMAVEELSFGTNMRGTAEYRKAICRVLVKRAVSEVWQCR